MTAATACASQTGIPYSPLAFREAAVLHVSGAASAAESPDTGCLERVTLRKVTRRLIPFLFVVYIACFLDRTNVGMAALQMNRDLNFSAAVYGFGVGVFFLGYCLFEVPSNLMLVRVGARRWIARIAITWGLIATATMFARGPLSFYALRFLLGVAEAGFFPGIVFYLCAWFPSAQRARALALFMTALPISGVVGSPLSGALLGLQGTLGLAGWQWLFLMEGIPSVFLGLVTLVFLTDRPETARWLAPEERAWLVGRLHAERESCAARHGLDLREALANPTVWRLALLWILMVPGAYSLTFWMPQIVKSLFGLSDIMVGVAVAAPLLAAAIGMVFVASRSDRNGERCAHVAIPAVLMAVGYLGSASFESSIFLFVALAMASVGFYALVGPFWALPTAFLSGRAAAAAIALINSVGNIGGFAGPYLMGYVKNASGGFSAAFLVFALMALGASVLALHLRHVPAFARRGIVPALPGS